MTLLGQTSLVKSFGAPLNDGNEHCTLFLHESVMEKLFCLFHNTSIEFS